MTRDFLAILNSRKKDRTSKEPRKVVVADTATTAIKRIAFHLLPISTTVAILVLNLRGIFIGYDLSGAIKSETISLMFLQLAAKAHEILIVASLGLIVLHAVRHELLFGDGLPLGLIGSGLSFSNFDLLFKKEFYGSLRYLTTHGNRKKKTGFVLLLLLSILVAALAGPSSAVLLVPRSQIWPSAVTEVFFNASDSDLWPIDLRGNLTQLSTLCQAENATALAVCPGAGFRSLREHWSRLNATSFFNQNIPPYARLLSGSLFYWPIRSPKSLVPPLYALGNSRQSDQLKDKTTLVQPLAAATVVLQQAADDWWKAMERQKQRKLERMDALIDDRQIRSRGKSAIGTVRCGSARLLEPSDTSVSFPTIPFWFDYGRHADYEVTNLSNTSSSAAKYQWIQLPGSFGPASIGGIFQSPWRFDNSSRIVIGCTAQLGWVPSDVRTDSYSFWSGWYPWNITYGERSPRYTAAPHDDALSAINGRVALGQQWLDMLTPRVSAEDQQSTIESILSETDFANAGGTSYDSTLKEWSETGLPNESRIALLEAIICSVLVDGLSRTSSLHAFDMDGAEEEWHLASYRPRKDFSRRILSGQNAFEPPAAEEGEFTTLNTAMSITGFALRPSLSSFLAMSVLLAHALLALGHIVWVLFDRRTSRSWESVSELIVLAQNSMPSFKILANTGAGIEKTRTFAQLARIRARNDADNEDEARVELVFEHETTEGTIPVTQQKYTKRQKFSLNGHSSREPSLSHVIDAAHIEHRPRMSWTWPQDPRIRSMQQEDTEMDSRSSSADMLIPETFLRPEINGELTHIVPNRVYG
jgi:hypothetical protein